LAVTVAWLTWTLSSAFDPLLLAMAVAIVAGAVIAGCAAVLAARNVPCAQECTALALRQEAIGGVQRDLAWVTLLPTLIAIARRFL
jgi:hypothetical protein